MQQNDFYGLEATLEAVKAIEGVKYLDRIPDMRPRINGDERLLAVHNQMMRARVDDATSPEWYAAAVKNAGSANVISTYLIQLPETALERVLGVFGQNPKISFHLPDKEVTRIEWN